VFGGGASSSVLHPAVLVALIILIILILSARRKRIIFPLTIGLFLIPLGQQLMIGGFHVYSARLLILAGCVRITAVKLSSKERIFSGEVNMLDKLFVAGSLARATATLILYRGQTGAIVNQGGFIWDTIGAYIVLRFLIHDEDDIKHFSGALAVVAVTVGGEMLREHFTGQDLFGLLGSVRTVVDTRNGTPRAQGPFSQSLLAGSWGATTVPLLFFLRREKGSKVLALAGLIGATIVVFTAMCSTPILAFVTGLGFKYLWPLRRRMRALRWAAALLIVVLQCVMVAPVWFVIAHIDLAGGSSGWDRANLIDQFLRHFSDWWLVGTNEYAAWGADTWDQCNQFVAEGENGGLLGLTCFVGTIVVALKWAGRGRKAFERSGGGEVLYWALGIAIFTHVVAFIGIDYFDQTRFSWYALIAMTSSVAAPAQLRFDGAATMSVAPSPDSAFPGSAQMTDSITAGAGEAEWMLTRINQ
jgi:hypothetical protein